MATYFADTSFWVALSSRRDQYHSRAVEWHAFVIRSGSKILTTEAILWEWLNAFSDPSTRGVAAEGYRRAHADVNVEAVPFQTELIDAAIRTDGASAEALTTDRHFAQANLKARMLEQPAG